MSTARAEGTIENLKRMYTLLPDVPEQWGKRPVHTQCEIIDSLSGKVLFFQHVEEPFLDKPSEGIAAFNSSVSRVTRTAQGEWIALGDSFYWRYVVMNYHGGYYLTVVNGVDENPHQLDPITLGQRIAANHNELARINITAALLARAPALPRNYRELALEMHDLNVTNKLGNRRPTGNECSIVYV